MDLHRHIVNQTLFGTAPPFESQMLTVSMGSTLVPRTDLSDRFQRASRRQISRLVSTRPAASPGGFAGLPLNPSDPVHLSQTASQPAGAEKRHSSGGGGRPRPVSPSLARRPVSAVPRPPRLSGRRLDPLGTARLSTRSGLSHSPRSGRQVVVPTVCRGPLISRRGSGCSGRCGRRRPIRPADETNYRGRPADGPNRGSDAAGAPEGPLPSAVRSPLAPGGFRSARCQLWFGLLPPCHRGILGDWPAERAYTKLSCP